jgi:uncharacterized protein YbaP (TraB family)
MNKKTLSQATKEHYASQSLSDQKLERYEKMLQATKVDTGALQSKKYSLLSAVASFLVLIIVGMQFYPAQGDIAFDIAQEVAKNHIKIKPLEVKSDQLSDLKEYFTQLDFALIDPEMMVGKTMKGARYCSIQGVTAAQFRYGENEPSQRVTVYEVEYKPEIFGEIPNRDKGMAPQEIKLKGLLIKLWLEKGLLLVSAQNDEKAKQKLSN